MSEYYQHLMSSAGGMATPHGMMPPEHHHAFHQPVHGQDIGTTGASESAYPAPYQSLGYFTGFPDPAVFHTPKTHNGRGRKRSVPGVDQVKHRRTRSGCYTCRSRRVKCDEGRPTCERCRKGKRECVYPEPSSAKTPTSEGRTKDSSTSEGQSPDSSQEDDDEDAETDSGKRLPPIQDEDEPEEPARRASQTSPTLHRVQTTSSPNLRRSKGRQNSETPSVDDTRSSSPPTSTGTAPSLTRSSFLEPASVDTRTDWSDLPTDIQFYLGYFSQNVTHYNYGVPNDHEGFFLTLLPSIATQKGNEALLYALVGFSAYLHTVQNPNGEILDFLQWYNKSVTLLLGSLKRGEKQGLGALIAILQLATIEEYLGDWVNLTGHQRAAYAILRQEFTPQSILQSPVGRMLMTWYVRFDVFVAMMAGFETCLPREWFVAAVDNSTHYAATYPEDLGWIIEAHATSLRLISVDMTVHFARARRGELLGKDFSKEHQRLEEQLHAWKNNLNPAITNAELRVPDSDLKPSSNNNSAASSDTFDMLYDFPLFPTTVLVAEWHSILVMHSSQEAMALQQETSDELRSVALATCGAFDKVSRWSKAPSGALIQLQACLAIAALFVPRDESQDMWFRRQYAMLESLGYIFPLAMRARMSEFFRCPSCVAWWLPNDEGLSPVLRKFRAFADERNSKPVSQKSESVREASAIFANLRLDEDGNPSPITPTSTTSSFFGHDASVTKR